MEPKDFISPNVGQVIRAKPGYWAFVPAPLPPNLNWSSPLVLALSEAERDLSKLATMAGAFPFPRLLIQPFVRREATLSSRIEGTRSSLVDLYMYESGQMSFIEPGDAHEVFNYVRALDFGMERLKSLPVSLRLIREVHAKLMEDVRGGNLTPGEFRRSQNWIGPAGSTLANATYVPPPADEMAAALDGLEKFIHADSGIPALVRTAMIHYQFEAVHPFLDGNGRIGRLLIILLFSEWGLLSQPLLNLSAYFELHRQEYYERLLSVSQRGEWEAWMLFFLNGVSVQARNSVTRVEKLQELRVKYQEIVTAERNVKRMEQVLDFLFTRPIFTARQMESALGIPFAAAQRYVEKLVRAGILREVTGYAKNRIFRADEIFKALDEG